MASVRADGHFLICGPQSTPGPCGRLPITSKGMRKRARDSGTYSRPRMTTPPGGGHSVTDDPHECRPEPGSVKSAKPQIPRPGDHELLPLLTPALTLLSVPT